MVGILLITHNGLGESLIDCVRHVMGSAPAHVKALSVLAQDDPVLKEEEARALIAELDDGQGVLLLSDVYGATPCNIARRLCQPGPHRRRGGRELADASARGVQLQQVAGRAGATRSGWRQGMYCFY